MAHSKQPTGDNLEKFVTESDDRRIDADVESQQQNNREKYLADWDEEAARAIAKARGYELTEAHLAVVHALRDHYRDNGQAEDGRELEDLLEARFADQGGKRYLYRLFPDGPVTEGLTLAKLPLPPYTVDAGFGTAR